MIILQHSSMSLLGKNIFFFELKVIKSSMYFCSSWHFSSRLRFVAFSSSKKGFLLEGQRKCSCAYQKSISRAALQWPFRLSWRCHILFSKHGHHDRFLGPLLSWSILNSADLYVDLNLEKPCAKLSLWIFGIAHACPFRMICDLCFKDQFGSLKS